MSAIDPCTKASAAPTTVSTTDPAANPSAIPTRHMSEPARLQRFTGQAVQMESRYGYNPGDLESPLPSCRRCGTPLVEVDGAGWTHDAAYECPRGCS